VRRARFGAPVGVGCHTAAGARDERSSVHFAATDIIPLFQDGGSLFDFAEVVVVCRGPRVRHDHPFRKVSHEGAAHLGYEYPGALERPRMVYLRTVQAGSERACAMTNSARLERQRSVDEE
jgi:hypothetical protein